MHNTLNTNNNDEKLCIVLAAPCTSYNIKCTGQSARVLKGAVVGSEHLGAGVQLFVDVREQPWGSFDLHSTLTLVVAVLHLGKEAASQSEVNLCLSSLEEGGEGKGD